MRIDTMRASGEVAPDLSGSGLSCGTVRRVVVDDVDDLRSVYEQWGVEPLQVAPGDRATEALSVAGSHHSFTATIQGFPTVTTASLPDDRISFASVRAAPPGCRWCGVDLEPDDVVVWGPSAEHAARNVPGLDIVAAQFDIDLVRSSGDRIGVDIGTVESGVVKVLRPGTEGLGTVHRALENYRLVATGGAAPGWLYFDDLVLAATKLLLPDPEPRRTRGHRRLEDRAVVWRCLEYADALGRIPSISELCLVAYVSERRLRQAFTAEFQMAPSRYFRMRALERARQRIVDPEAPIGTVSAAASDVGFGHLGRFASQYREAFGELPSATLSAVDGERNRS